MNRVIVDTNVLVSALIGKGNPRVVINTIFQGRVTLVLSNAVIAEYERVLQRPKFSRYSEFSTYASATIKSLQSIAQLPFSHYRGTGILSPKEFVTLYKKT